MIHSYHGILAHSYHAQETPPNPWQEGRRPPAPPARECSDTPWTPRPNDIFIFLYHYIIPYIRIYGKLSM